MSTLLSASIDGQELVKLRDDVDVLLLPNEGYFTLQAAQDEAKLYIQHVGSASLSGDFKISQDGTTWVTVPWSNISYGVDYDILEFAFSKTSLSKGEKVIFKDVAAWASSSSNITAFRTAGTAWKASGMLSKSFSPTAHLFGILTCGDIDVKYVVADMPCEYACASRATLKDVARSVCNAAFPAVQAAASQYDFFCCDQPLQEFPPVLAAPSVDKYSFRRMFAYTTGTAIKNTVQKPFYMKIMAEEDVCSTPPSRAFNRMFFAQELASGTRIDIHLERWTAGGAHMPLFEVFFTSGDNQIEIHYKASMFGNAEFIADGGPYFGHENAVVYYDL